jgi:hypothetical protein
MYRMNKGRDDTHREELRMWLAKRLRVEDVPRPLWGWLEEQGDVDEVLDGNRPLDREDLLDIAKERLQFAKEMAPFVGGSPGTFTSARGLDPAGMVGQRRLAHAESQIYDPVLDPLAERMMQLVAAGVPIDPKDAGVVGELLDRRARQLEAQSAASDNPVIQRAEAFSLYLAKLASEDPKVKNFRREVLGDGAYLSKEEAEDFIFSPATALFDAAWFKEEGVPFTGHTVGILELETLSSRRPRRLRGTAKVEWDGGGIVSPFEGAVLSSDPFERRAVGSESVPALKESVISDLLLLDEHLRGRFPWHPLHRDVLQVAMFVLTGSTPWVEPLRATVPEGYPDLYQTVDITVWPWVPVEEVTLVYERVRKELNPTPTTSPRRLALFIFVLVHPEVEVANVGDRPKVPSWRELHRLWNEHFPGGSEWYYKDVRNFQRDFKEAFDQITNFYRSDTWFTKIDATGWDDWDD